MDTLYINRGSLMSFELLYMVYCKNSNYTETNLNASSTAISSNGFIECLTPSVTTPLLSGLTLI